MSGLIDKINQIFGKYKAIPALSAILLASSINTDKLHAQEYQKPPIAYSKTMNDDPVLKENDPIKYSREMENDDKVVTLYYEYRFGIGVGQLLTRYLVLSGKCNTKNLESGKIGILNPSIRSDSNYWANIEQLFNNRENGDDNYSTIYRANDGVIYGVSDNIIFPNNPSSQDTMQKRWEGVSDQEQAQKNMADYQRIFNSPKPEETLTEMHVNPIIRAKSSVINRCNMS